MTDLELLQLALKIAIKAHANQFDKIGNPYIKHPVAVCNMLTDLKDKQVALLHDVCEDSSITLDDLKAYGFSFEVVSAVEAITKRKDEPYEEYIARVKKNKIATRVKICDIKHNQDPSRICLATEADRQRQEKYKRALIVLQSKNDRIL
ncbi:MAG: HD domain-containing protein [Clostridia bacterium]